MRIFPLPLEWVEVHENLMNFSRNQACDPSSPPKPLILAGWNFSSDWEKKLRWDETLEWANKNGCSFLIDDLKEEDFYRP